MSSQRITHYISCIGSGQLRQAVATYSVSAAVRNRMRVRVRTDKRGFTLIELLIVLAIVAVLSTMVVPGYSRYFTEARRADAHDMLYKNARILQNCLTLAGAFDAGCDLITVSASGHYELSESLTPNTWQLSAVPTPGGSQASDGNCTMITLDHIGRKTATGSDTERCW